MRLSGVPAHHIQLVCHVVIMLNGLVKVGLRRLPLRFRGRVPQLPQRLGHLVHLLLGVLQVHLFQLHFGVLQQIQFLLQAVHILLKPIHGGAHPGHRLAQIVRQGKRDAGVRFSGHQMSPSFLRL